MRPKDDKGIPLPPAHKRVDPVRYHEAALFAMDADPRSPALSMKRKLQLIDRAMNTALDGDAPPGWVWKKDDLRPNENFLPDLWRLALSACQRVKHLTPQSKTDEPEPQPIEKTEQSQMDSTADFMSSPKNQSESKRRRSGGPR